jgi:DNA primase
MPSREKISSDQIQALKQRLDLREIAAQYTDLRGQGKEWYGPCPRCGGHDRLHVQQHMFFCRQCLPPEKGRHDVLDFLMWVGEARDFREAYEVLSGSMNTLPSPVRHLPSLAESGTTYETQKWQEHAQQEMARCHTLLLSEQGTLGQAYLRQRGLMPEAWQAARLGLTPRLDSEGHKGWAISIPWWYDNQVTAIQYRFIEPRAQQRYTRYQYGGHYGETVLFTLPPKRGSTLVACEGEFNALSVWQATPYDVVSVGSQNMTQRTLEALSSHVQGYEHIWIWADQKNVTAAVLQALGDRAAGVEAAADANELLQRGMLQEFLA